MSDLLADFWVHEVTVERYAGSGARGDTFDAPTVIAGFVDDDNKLVVAQGQQVVSSARVFFPAQTAAIPIKSRITLPAPFLGRSSQVIAMSRHDAGALGTPDHLEVALQ